MKGKCANCGTSEHHAWKGKIIAGEFVGTCGDCTKVSARHTPMHAKKQQEANAKDIIQPYKYDKQEKGMIPNKDFEKVYGKKKANAFSNTISTEKKRQRENVSLDQAVKPATG